MINAKDYYKYIIIKFQKYAFLNLKNSSFFNVIYNYVEHRIKKMLKITKKTIKTQ